MIPCELMIPRCTTQFLPTGQMNDDKKYCHEDEKAFPKSPEKRFDIKYCVPDRGITCDGYVLKNWCSAGNFTAAYDKVDKSRLLFNKPGDHLRKGFQCDKFVVGE